MTKLNLTHGQRINFTHRIGARLANEANSKLWLYHEIVPITGTELSGLWLGWRTLSEGYKRSFYEESTFGLSAVKYTEYNPVKHFRVALVSFNPRYNPIYVPDWAIHLPHQMDLL